MSSVMFQNPGPEVSHLRPITLGRHGHWPVSLSQGPPFGSVPMELHTHSVKQISLTEIVSILLQHMYENLFEPY